MNENRFYNHLTTNHLTWQPSLVFVAVARVVLDNINNQICVDVVVWFGGMQNGMGEGIGMKGTMSFSPRVGLYLAAIGLAIITTSASAVQYTFEGETGGGLVMAIQTSGGSQYDYVGQMNFATSTSGWLATLSTYCTDVGVSIASTYNYTPLSFTAAASVGGVNPTWISGGIQNAAAIWYANKGSAVTVDQQAGLQLAIWEALYNNKSTYTAGSFFSSSNGGFHILSSDVGDIAVAATDAAGYLNGLSGDLAAPSGDWLEPNNDCGSQGLLYPSQVPEATSTLMLLGAALTTLGFASRKLRSK
jgi:hypothetical protein